MLRIVVFPTVLFLPAKNALTVSSVTFLIVSPFSIFGFNTRPGRAGHDVLTVEYVVMHYLQSSRNTQAIVARFGQQQRERLPH